MILTLTFNPAVDITLRVDGLKLHDTNRIKLVEHDAGGKGVNLSRFAHQIGGSTMAMSFVGGNPGMLIRGRLRHEEVPNLLVKTQSPTRQNFVIEDESGLPPTALNASGGAVSDSELQEFKSGFRSHLVAASWACFCGSLGGSLSLDEWTNLMREAKASRVKVLVDADGEQLRAAVELGPDLIKPNVAEASRLLDRNIKTVDEARIAAQELSSRLVSNGSTLGMAIVSLGSRGAVLASPQGTWYAESVAVEPVSTIGCGDSMLGAFLVAYELGLESGECLRWGSAAGAATALSPGTRLGSKQEFESCLARARVSG